MIVDDAIALVDELLQPEGLNDLQASVFRYCWQGEGYQEIADALGYDSGYIRTVGSKLWQQLSDIMGKKVTKSNLHSVFRQYNQPSDQEKEISPQETIATPPEFPGLPLNANSLFYVDRHPIEQRCAQEILQPGALIRIQAPKQMGKTSLLYRLLEHGRAHHYKTLRLSCQEATTESFTDLNSFLRWLCRSAARKLKQTPNLEQYWDDDLSFAKSNCTEYFENYLLSNINTPIILGLDDIERVFAYPQIAQDFFPLLRVWHEEANEIDIWQNLRLIVVHSTEVYVPLDINQSPFNVGLPIYLPELKLEQIQELALRYGLNWADGNMGEEALRPLMEMVGGHPYLIQLALYHIWENQQQKPLVNLNNILRDAPTDAGIYGSHLRRLWETLNSSPSLCSAMKKVVSNDQPVAISPLAAYKLQSMGLIKLAGNLVTTRYKLYQDYFRSRLELNP